MKNNKKSRFNLYDWLYKRNRKEDEDDDKDEPRTFLFFFKLLGRNIGRLLSINLYFVFGNIALFLLLLMLTGAVGPSSSAPVSDLFAPLMGTATATKAPEGSFAINMLLTIHGTVTEISVMTPLMITLTIIAVAIFALTFGPVMAGLTLNLRSMVKGEPIFMWGDFWHAIKTNLVQSIILGVLDIGIIFLLVYGAVFYYQNMGLFVFNVFFLFTLVLLVIYLFMRKYLYLMLVTFELSIPKLFKNALIFSILGAGRNIVSTLGCLAVVLINLFAFVTFMPLGLILPFILTIGVCLFIDAYAAWPKIQSIMIDPYIGMEDEEE